MLIPKNTIFNFRKIIFMFKFIQVYGKSQWVVFKIASFIYHIAIKLWVGYLKERIWKICQDTIYIFSGFTLISDKLGVKNGKMCTRQAVD